MLWHIPPPTIGLLDVHNRLQDHTSRMFVRPSLPPSRWEHPFEFIPQHFQPLHTGLSRLVFGSRSTRDSMNLLGWLLPHSFSIVVPARPGLMPPSPSRPVQYVLQCLFQPYIYLPEQLPDFATTQSYRSPRLALNAAREWLVCSISFFPIATSEPISWRTTVRNACAHIASVM